MRPMPALIAELSFFRGFELCVTEHSDCFRPHNVFIPCGACDVRDSWGLQAVFASVDYSIIFWIM